MQLTTVASVSDHRALSHIKQTQRNILTFYGGFPFLQMLKRLFPAAQAFQCPLFEMSVGENQSDLRRISKAWQRGKVGGGLALLLSPEMCELRLFPVS